MTRLKVNQKIADKETIEIEKVKWEVVSIVKGRVILKNDEDNGMTIPLSSSNKNLKIGDIVYL